MHLQLQYDLKQMSLSKNEHKEVGCYHVTFHSAAVMLNGDDWTQYNECLQQTGSHRRACQIFMYSS